MAAVPAPLGDNSERFELAQVAYRKMIKAYAWQCAWILPGYDHQDLENELLEVLWLACKSYDPDKGMKFNTWFRQRVKQRFLDLEKSAKRKKRAGDYDQISLDAADVRVAIENFLGDITGDFEANSESSAEDIALANIRVQELYNSGRRIK